jgi:hypothetical protein
MTAPAIAFPDEIPTRECRTLSDAEMLRESRTRLRIPPGRSIMVKVTTDGQTMDASALAGRQLAIVYRQLKERVPELLAESEGECPADEFAIVERALMLHEIMFGGPFEIEQ